MTRTTKARSGWAALASGALVAGGLVVAPAMAGIGAATAAPVNLGYTCVVSGFGPPQSVDSSLSIELTAPETVAPGEEFTVGVSYTLDMSGALMGPVNPVAGGVKFDFAVGDVPTQATIPAANWTPAEGGLKRIGQGDVTLTAPEAEGETEVSVGAVALSGTASVGATTVPFNPACTPDAEQDQTIGALDVAEPAPEGLAYTCTITGGGFTVPLASSIDLEVTVPETVEAGKEFPVDVDGALDMGSSSFGPIQSLAGTFDVPLTIGGDTSTVTLSSSSAPVSALAFAGTGSGDLEAPDELGDAPVEVGTIVGHLTTTPFGMALEVPCVPAEGQDQTVASTIVEKAAPVAVPVKGKVAVSGKALVGKTVKAVPGKAAGAKVAYQWLANGKAIKKATKSTLKLGKSLAGKRVSVRATYTKSGFIKVVQTSKTVKVVKAKKKK